MIRPAFTNLLITAYALVLCYAGSPPLCASEAPDIITVQQEARVSGDVIRLGEIATIEGELATIENFENIVVGRAPLAGQERNLTREQIVARLRQHNVDMKKTTLNCPRDIKILSEYKAFTPEDLEAITRDFILANAPWNKNAVTIEGFAAKPVTLPKGTVSYGFAVQNNEDYLGKFNADIIFTVDGRELQRVRVSAVIRVMVPVAVCSGRIERHAAVQAADVTMETKDLATLPRTIVTDMQTLMGKRSKTSIIPGTVLKHDMFEADAEVRKGDIVTIAVTNPLFTITGSGEALESGNRGELIPVVNLTSKNKVYGYVKNNKEVEVRY
jgi:flagella basal body P-ring formation protein FlgA